MQQAQACKLFRILLLGNVPGLEMKNTFSKRHIIPIAAALMLFIGGIGSFLFFSASEKVLPVQFKAFSGETMCVFPPVLEKPPRTLGFISWRYTVRAKYHFPADKTAGYRTFSVDNPPPNMELMIPIDVPAGVEVVLFESAEAVLEPFVLNICLRPLSKKWKFTVPEKLPTTLE